MSIAEVAERYMQIIEIRQKTFGNDLKWHWMEIEAVP